MVPMKSQDGLKTMQDGGLKDLSMMTHLFKEFTLIKEGIMRIQSYKFLTNLTSDNMKDINDIMPKVLT